MLTLFSQLTDLGITQFALFLSSAIVFILTPAIDTVFVINTTLSQGKKAGILSVLGVATGVLVHTFFASMGLVMILGVKVAMSK